MNHLLANLFIFVLILFVISYLAKKRVKKTNDFLLGGRAMSPIMTAFGAGCSDMGSWLLMVLPASVYLTGVNNAWLPISLVVGSYFNWTFIAKKLRVYTEAANDSLTLPSYLHFRFSKDSESKNNSIRLISSIAMLIFFTVYAASGFIAGAKIMQYVFDISYLEGLFVIAVIIVFYTAIGGFIAVNSIDVFQGCLILFSMVILPIFAISQFSDFHSTLNHIQMDFPNKFNLFTDVNYLTLISLAGWGLGYFGQPHVNVRFMAIRSIKDLPLATSICIGWMIITMSFAILIGIVGMVYYPQGSLEDADLLFIVMSDNLFSTTFHAIVIAAIISAIMSSISAQILMSVSTFTEDLCENIVKNKLLFIKPVTKVRLAVFLWSGISISIAVIQKDGLFNAIGFAWSGLGAAFGPVTLISLYWKNMSKAGAISGILSGILIVLLWQTCKALHVGWLFNDPNIQSGFELIPAFIISSISIFIFSVLYPSKNKKTLKLFQQMNINFRLLSAQKS